MSETLFQEPGGAPARRAGGYKIKGADTELRTEYPSFVCTRCGLVVECCNRFCHEFTCPARGDQPFTYDDAA